MEAPGLSGEVGLEIRGSMGAFVRLLCQHRFVQQGNVSSLAPLRLLQRVGLRQVVDRLGRFLPRSLRLLQEILPPLEPHYGRLPELLSAEGKRRARARRNP